MATKYARAGGGNWSADATWSTTSGGAADTTAPTAADDVILDSNSGDVTIDAPAARLCRSLDCTSGTGIYAGTLAHQASSTLTVGDGTSGAGNVAVKLTAGMTYTADGTSTLNVLSSSGTAQTITTAGKTLPSLAIYNGSFTLQDAFTNTGGIYHVSGTFNTNSQTVTSPLYSSSNSNVRTLTLGSSAITISGTGTAWSAGTTTNLTVTANTATVTLTGAAAALSLGSVNWNGASFTHTGSGAVGITSTGATVQNYTRIGTAAKTDTLVMNNTGFTVAGTYTVTGNSATNRVLNHSGVLGSARTITAATVSATHCDFRDITGAGAGSWDFSAAEIGNALGNSGMTFRAGSPRYAVATGNVSDTGTWSATSGGAPGASVPLCHDTIVLNAASGAITVTNDMPRMCADLTCTGYTGTLAMAATDIHGSVTLGSGMTLSGLVLVTLRGRSSHTITSAGKTWLPRLLVDCTSAGTYTLADALNAGYTGSFAFGVNSGVLADGGFSVTISAALGSMIVSGGTLNASGTWTIASTANTDPWYCTGGTVNHTGTIVLSGATATDRTFAGGGKTYGTLTDQNTLGGKLTVTGANTFGTINKTATVACTLALPTSSGITVTGQFNVQGVSGAVLTLTGDITKASGLVECDFMSISSSDATGGARFYAPNSTDGGSNTGWIFTAAPTPTSTGNKSLVYQLNRLAGTSGLEMAGAANAWAGTSGLEVVGALNARIRQVNSSHPGGLELNGACRELARLLGGDPSYDAPAALASIPT